MLRNPSPLSLTVCNLKKEARPEWASLSQRSVAVLKGTNYLHSPVRACAFFWARTHGFGGVSASPVT